MLFGALASSTMLSSVQDNIWCASILLQTYSKLALHDKNSKKNQTATLNLLNSLWWEIKPL